MDSLKDINKYDMAELLSFLIVFIATISTLLIVSMWMIKNLLIVKIHLVMEVKRLPDQNLPVQWGTAL